MREWYVIRIGRPEDQNKGHWMPTGPQGEPQPIINNGGWGQLDIGVQLQQPQAGQRVRPRNQPQPADEFVVPAPVQQRQVGFGYYVKPASGDDKSGVIVFNSGEIAEAYAKEQAALHPRVMYGIFSCEKVFETTEPVIVVKSYNDGGELIIQKEEENV